MAKRAQSPRRKTPGPIEQLDQAVDAIMTSRNIPRPRVDAKLAALLKVAGELRDLPRPDFKARLKSELASSETPAAASAEACLVIRDPARAIDYYKRAFGAKELMRLEEPGTHNVMHAEIQIGATQIAIAPEEGTYNQSPEKLGGSAVVMRLYVDDADKFAKRALAEGARIIFPIADQFYGQRAGRIADPFGHVWVVATRNEDVPAEELNRRAGEFVKQRQSAQVSPIPHGMHSVTPYLQVAGAARLIDFMKRAFNAEELKRVNMPNGTIGHAQMKVSGSIIELADANQQFNPMPTAIWLYVDDADATYRRAIAAGATSLHEPMDQDYGNREGSVRDPFGNHWYIATRLPDREPWPEELRTITPYLHPQGSSQVIEFMKRAFDAREVERHEDGGVVHHAQVKIGDSIIAMGDAHGAYTPMPPALHLYVPDADRVYRRALRAGAKSMFEPHDAPYGDRMSGVTDPFGNVWYIATHQRDVPVEEMERTASAPEPAASAPEPEHNERDIMPFLNIRGAEKAAEFYKQIFGATEMHRDVSEATGLTRHVQIKIGDARIMISDPGAIEAKDWVEKGWIRTATELGGTPVHLYQYVDDADEVFQRAVAAGVQVTDPIQDKPWGDRCGGFIDPFGQIWSVATPLKKTAEEKE